MRRAKGGPRLAVCADQPYVAIPIEVSLKELGRAVALFGELRGWLAERAAEVAGPPFLRYWTWDDGGGRSGIEVGIPVVTDLVGDGRVFGDVISGGTYATFLDDRFPDGLTEAHRVLREWADRRQVQLDAMEEAGRTVWCGAYEFFLADPTGHPTLRGCPTELAYRVRSETGP
ncbi:MAG: hypothetical protein GEU90_03095 [Gemmatimonas sp.]|nr:hypothetical protein [Gemmatimonas sp.]